MLIEIILLVSSLLLIADFFFLNYLWIYFDDKLFDAFYVFLIAILSVVLVCSLIKLFTLITKSKRNRIIKALSIVSIIVLFVGSGFVLTTINKPKQIVSLTNICEKETNENNEYFLVVNNLELKKFIRVRCDKKTFCETVTDQYTLYTIEYRIGFFNNNYGVLGKIDKAIFE